MVRIAKSKESVDVSSNTIRKFAREGGLRLYKLGKVTFFSRSELINYIRSAPEVQS